MTTFMSTITDRARRSSDHPGYGWIDAQPAIQLAALEAHGLCGTHTGIATVLVSVQPMLNDRFAPKGKGAQEGLT
jgi:hypothetical protein